MTDNEILTKATSIFNQVLGTRIIKSVTLEIFPPGDGVPFFRASIVSGEKCITFSLSKQAIEYSRFEIIHEQFLNAFYVLEEDLKISHREGGQDGAYPHG